MGDRRPPAPRPLLLSLGAVLAIGAVALGLVVGVSDDDEQVGHRSPAPTDPPTTTTSSSPPSTTATTPPPTTAPPAVDADAAALALEFLVAVADEEVIRDCRAGEFVVRRDHPEAQLRVAVVGDSLTVQTVGLLTSDARFDWTVISVCGARVDHFAGGALFESSYDLTAGLDAALADAPDILVFALGTNDALKETYEGRAVEHGPSIAALLARTGGVRCRAWIDVHTVSVGQGGAYERWGYYAGRFNDALRAQAGPAGVGLLGWGGVVAANDPPSVLTVDGVHLTPTGRTLRARLVADALTGLANDCVLAAPPPPPPPTDPPATPPPTAAPSSPPPTAPSTTVGRRPVP